MPPMVYSSVFSISSGSGCTRTLTNALLPEASDPLRKLPPPT